MMLSLGRRSLFLFNREFFFPPWRWMGGLVDGLRGGGEERGEGGWTIRGGR